MTHLRIAGRTFHRSGPTTLAHDAYILKRWRRFGLSSIAPTLESGKRAPNDVLGTEIDRLIADAFESGLLYEVLAGMLVEEGIPWSVSWANDAVKVFAAITDADEKQIIYNSLSDIITDFFAHAVDWIVTSRKSSSSPDLPTAAPTSSLLPSEATLDTTMANGTPLSATLPDGDLAVMPM